MKNINKISKVFKPKTNKELKNITDEFFNKYPELLNFNNGVVMSLFEKGFSYGGPTTDNKYFIFSKHPLNIFITLSITLEKIKESI